MYQMSRTPQYELEILRVSLARIAQACGPDIELEIPGADGRTGLVFSELAVLARIDRGWNRLAAFVVDHCMALKEEMLEVEKNQ
jgi:hypothetical protein